MQKTCFTSNTHTHTCHCQTNWKYSCPTRTIRVLYTLKFAYICFATTTNPLYLIEIVWSHVETLSVLHTMPFHLLFCLQFIHSSIHNWHDFSSNNYIERFDGCFVSRDFVSNTSAQSPKSSSSTMINVLIITHFRQYTLKNLVNTNRLNGENLDVRRTPV